MPIPTNATENTSTARRYSFTAVLASGDHHAARRVLAARSRRSRRRPPRRRAVSALRGEPMTMISVPRRSASSTIAGPALRRARGAVSDADAVRVADRARLVELAVRDRPRAREVVASRAVERNLEHAQRDDRARRARRPAGRRRRARRRTAARRRPGRACAGTRARAPAPSAGGAFTVSRERRLHERVAGRRRTRRARRRASRGPTQRVVGFCTTMTRNEIPGREPSDDREERPVDPAHSEGSAARGTEAPRRRVCMRRRTIDACATVNESVAPSE